jgi:chitin elicitor receptor kinase 1
MIPFSCDCLGEGDNRYLGHLFQYNLNGGDTYEIIAGKYVNLTTTPWLQKVNSYNENSILEGSTVNVSINYSCGNAEINKSMGSSSHILS